MTPKTEDMFRRALQFCGLEWKERYAFGEAAKLLGVSLHTLRDLEDEGKLRMYRITKSRCWVFAEDLAAYLMACERGGS